MEKGATEIDIVINRPLVITGKWQELYQEIQQMKEACGPKAHMKAILATGELGSMANVRLVWVFFSKSTRNMFLLWLFYH